MSKAVVGIRTSRSARLVFAETSESELAGGTPLLCEIAGAPHLAFVDLPSDLLREVPPDAVTGKVVGVGRTSATVAAALAERDAAALAIAQRVLGPTLRVQRAEWSVDQAWLTVVVASRISENLAGLADELAREIKAEIRFQSIDGSLVRPVG
jgi:hypothetical protein